MSRLAGILSVTTGLLLSAAPAVAQPPPSPAPPAPISPPVSLLPDGSTFTALATTNQQNGAVDYAVNGGATNVQAGSGSNALKSGVRRSGPSCTASTTIPSGVQLPFYDLVGPQAAAPPPGTQVTYNGQALPNYGTVSSNNIGSDTLVIVSCGGVPKGFAFLTPPKPGAPAPVRAPTPAQIQTIAESVAGQIPMPNVAIQANPPVGGGTVHVDTWFYATGYNGGPIRVTPPTPGVTIAILATPTSYLWTFGDGSPPLSTKSLGVPWQAAYTPATAHADCTFDGTPTHIDTTVPGSVTHCWTAPSSSVTVSLTFNFAVSYSVNGGPQIPLPPIQRSATLSYPVQIIDSLVTARG